MKSQEQRKAAQYEQRAAVLVVLKADVQEGHSLKAGQSSSI